MLAFQLWSLIHGIASLRICMLGDTGFEMEPLIDGAINQTLDGIFS